MEAVQPSVHSEQKFSSPEEELVHLREQVAIRERELQARGAEMTTEDVISDKIRDYSYAPVNSVLHEDHKLETSIVKELALNLAPETHDAKITELASILKEKGLKNVLSVLEEMNDSHVSDDFHRFLVQYIKKGLEAPGLTSKTEMFRDLQMTLYEVSLPDGHDQNQDKDSKERPVKEIISAMEQFYAGMLSIGTGAYADPHLALEIANPNHSEEFIFFVAVPDSKKDLFEKQILSLFPYAKIKDVPDDYNIFNETGVTLASALTQKNHPIYPIKTYDQFDHDPLNVVLNTFSKIKKDGEGAALQVVFRPPGTDYFKSYKGALEQIQKGISVKKALPKGVVGDMWEGVKDAFFTKAKKDTDKPKPIDENVVENIQNKIATPILEANIRIIASAATEQESQRILSDIESSFNQFQNTHGNTIGFNRLSGLKLRSFTKEFSFRSFSTSEIMPLSIKEISSLFHFPGETIKSSPQLKQSKAAQAAAPLDMPTEGTLLGINKFRNLETKVYMTKEDRLRHMYVIGQTGVGKSVYLKNMAVQDILQGDGICFIDPHGVDVLDVLASVPPERYEDVIYFDPSHVERPMALNMLEYDRSHPEQKTFVVNEMLSIFNKLFDMKTAGGPMFEQYFRNATMLVIEDPDSGNTLLEISKVMANKQFRELKLSRCKNPIVVQFWKEIAEKAGGESSLQNMVPYITSKFDVFLSNDIMRPIISQEKSSFNFRDIMDNKKILLVNLAKGRLGDINANLIGLILVGKILMAALSRADSLHLNPPPFYLYIDEFQNVTTDSIATILSEARKYKLSLNVAHQYISQLDEKIRDAVFGNVGSMSVFRVGTEDAEFLEKQFAPVFTAKDIMNIENRNAYLKLLINGRPVRPFSIEAMPPPKGNPEVLEKLKELSYLKFGRDKDEVEADTMEKYKKPPVPPAPASVIPKIPTAP